MTYKTLVEKQKMLKSLYINAHNQPNLCVKITRVKCTIAVFRLCLNLLNIIWWPCWTVKCYCITQNSSVYVYFSYFFLKEYFISLSAEETHLNCFRRICNDFCFSRCSVVPKRGLMLPELGNCFPVKCVVKEHKKGGAKQLISAVISSLLTTACMMSFMSYGSG